MKTKLLSFLTALCLLGGAMACDKKKDPDPEVRAEFPLYYYWIDWSINAPKRFELTVDLNYVSIVVDSVFRKSADFDSLLQKYGLEQLGQVGDMTNLKFGSPPATLSEYSTRLNALRQDGQIDYAMPVVDSRSGISGAKSGIYYWFDLKLKTPEDSVLLDILIKHHRMQIVEGFSGPLWYLISIGSSNFLHGIDAANFFQETGYFDIASPKFSTFPKYQLPPPFLN